MSSVQLQLLVYVIDFVNFATDVFSPFKLYYTILPV